MWFLNGQCDMVFLIDILADWPDLGSERSYFGVCEA